MVTTHTVEPRYESSSLVKARSLGKVSLMANAARSLDVFDGQHRLLPGQSGVMGLSNLCGPTLSAVTNNAAPVFDVMLNKRVGTERLGNGGREKGRFSNPLVASRAAVHHTQLG